MAKRSKERVDLEVFQRHARKMSVNTGQTPEQRAQWKLLAAEADEHVRREAALEDGLFAAGEVAPDDETLF